MKARFAERALRGLRDACRRLGTSSDLGGELLAVLDRARGLLGDGAVLDIHASNGSVRRIVAADKDAHRAVLADPRFDLRAPDASRAPVASLVCLPLQSRGVPVGTLAFVRFGRSRTSHGPEERELAEDVAHALALAIDNRRLEEAMEARRLELQRANENKDAFLASVSHELRTPLNAIVGWTDMIRSGALSGDELKRAIDTLDRNAHALASVVGDLLDVSRIVTGTLKVDSKSVSLATAVEVAVELARPACSSKRIRLVTEIDRVGCVHGDGGRLRQIVGNIVSNAIRFTPAGGCITVRVDRVGSVARVHVIDTGEGIAADLLPFVFERFWRADPRGRGLGLGLSIVKHLVESHGGVVRAASEGPGFGTTITVELPIAAEETSTEEMSSPWLPVLSEPSLDGLRVLLVEDDPDSNELLARVLETYGATVVAVSTVAAADAALENERIDVVVSDIGLPDGDGLELVRRVRSRPDAPPAIAVSAYASRQDAARAVGAGFSAHVAKPVKPLTLAAAVARVAAGARAERAGKVSSTSAA